MPLEHVSEAAQNGHIAAFFPITAQSSQERAAHSESKATCFLNLWHCLLSQTSDSSTTDYKQFAEPLQQGPE